MLWFVVGESWIWSQGDFLFWSPLRELALYSRVLVISWNMSITYKYMYLRTAMDIINTNFWQFSSPNIWTLNIIYPLVRKAVTCLPHRAWCKCALLQRTKDGFHSKINLPLYLLGIRTSHLNKVAAGPAATTETNLAVLFVVVAACCRVTRTQEPRCLAGCMDG